MNVLIIEDEIPAAEKLERYLAKYDASIQVLTRLTSVKDAVSWLQEKQDKVLKERLKDPAKRWKVTAEDFRNREKRDA